MIDIETAAKNVAETGLARLNAGDIKAVGFDQLRQITRELYAGDAREFELDQITDISCEEIVKLVA